MKKSILPLLSCVLGMESQVPSDLALLNLLVDFPFILSTSAAFFIHMQANLRTAMHFVVNFFSQTLSSMKDPISALSSSTTWVEKISLVLKFYHSQCKVHDDPSLCSTSSILCSNRPMKNIFLKSFLPLWIGITPEKTFHNVVTSVSIFKVEIILLIFGYFWLLLLLNFKLFINKIFIIIKKNQS